MSNEKTGRAKTAHAKSNERYERGRRQRKGILALVAISSHGAMTALIP
jgi:hypothetical protein